MITSFTTFPSLPTVKSTCIYRLGNIYLWFVVPCIFKYSIKQPNVCTINLIFIALSRRHRLTWFRHCCAHHQEPLPTAFAASGYRMTVNRPQLATRSNRQSYGNQRLQRQLEGAPDDGHNSVRNMLSGVYAKKSNEYRIYCSSGWMFYWILEYLISFAPDGSVRSVITTWY
jgi:hypothetical protein